MTESEGKLSHQYAVIMAGGSGTRLWPLSRGEKPKQFQKLIGDETLVQAMWRHLRSVFPADHIFVMASRQFATLIGEQLPELPTTNVLFEPSARDTGPAIILATQLLVGQDQEAVVGVFWSDHLIRQPEEFTRVIKTAYEAATEHPDQLVGVGVKPTFPDTGLGYIKMGQAVGLYHGAAVFRVAEAVEKPELKRATRFVQSWEYLWNTGYKVFAGQLLLKLFLEHYPELAEPLKTTQGLISEGQQTEVLSAAWEAFPKMSIELMLTDRLNNMLVVPADLGWSDVGNWKTLHDVLADESTIVSRGEHLSHGDVNVLAYAHEKLIVTIGLKDTIVVETPDAILVADKNKAQEVKQVVLRLKEEGRAQYL